MTMHLIKLSVGPESLAELEAWQAKRLRQTAELVHVTRHRPKRAGEILDGGSIYWVIKGWLCARQKMLELRPLMRDGIPHCGLVYDKELIRVHLRPHRPFQGWRYFAPEDAPPDLTREESSHDLPDHVRRELTALGLL